MNRNLFWVRELEPEKPVSCGCFIVVICGGIWEGVGQVFKDPKPTCVFALSKMTWNPFIITYPKTAPELEGPLVKKLKLLISLKGFKPLTLTHTHTIVAWLLE